MFVKPPLRERFADDIHVWMNEIQLNFLHNYAFQIDQSASVTL